MLPRWRWVIALVVATAAFAAVVWLDADVLDQARHAAAASFDEGVLQWLFPLTGLSIAAGVLLFGGLAWWARSLVVSLVFLVAGLVQLVAQSLLFGTSVLADGLTPPLLTWLLDTKGPLNAELILSAGLAIAGVIGLVSWLRRDRVRQG